MDKQLTSFDCIVIARKCRKQLARAQGMKDAAKLFEEYVFELQMPPLDAPCAIRSKADEIIRKYKARLEEIVALQCDLNAEMDDNE